MKRGAEEERRREQGKIPNLKEQRYVDFVRDADVALAEGKAILVARVHSASEKDWRAAAWMLERKFPSQYGQTLRSDVTAKVDVKVSQDLSKLSDDELEALRALVDKVDTSGEGSK
jgi:transposase